MPSLSNSGAPHVAQDKGKFNAGVADTCPETVATSSESGKSFFQDAQSRQQSMDFSTAGDTAPVLTAPKPVPPVAPSEKGDDEPAPTTPEETAPGTPKRSKSPTYWKWLGFTLFFNMHLQHLSACWFLISQVCMHISLNHIIFI